MSSPKWYKEPKEYIINPYLPQNALHVIVGRSGAGKSHFCFQIMKKYYDLFQPILYIAMDRSLNPHYTELFDKVGLDYEAIDIFSKIDSTTADLTNIRNSGGASAAFIEMIRTRQSKVDKKRDFMWLVQLLEEKRNEGRLPKTVVIDPGQQVVPTANLNNQGTVAQALSLFASVVKQMRITMILNWHVNKIHVGNLNDTYDKLSGSHALQGYCSTKIILDPPSFVYGIINKVVPTRLCVRGQNFPDIQVDLVRRGNGTFMPKDEYEKYTSEWPLYESFLEAACNTLTTRDLEDLGTHSSVHRWIADMLEAGIIEKPERATYKLLK